MLHVLNVCNSASSVIAGCYQVVMIEPEIDRYVPLMAAVPLRPHSPLLMALSLGNTVRSLVVNKLFSLILQNENRFLMALPLK